MAKYANYLKYNPLDNQRKAAELAHLLTLEAQDIRQTADYNAATNRRYFSNDDYAEAMHEAERVEELAKLLKQFAGDSTGLISEEKS